MIELMPALISTLFLPMEIALALGILFAITGLASVGGVGVMVISLGCAQRAGVTLERIAARKASASSAFLASLGETLVSIGRGEKSHEAWDQ